MAFAADDDVVVDDDAERTGGLDDGLGHLDVRARGGRVAGGVVVHQSYVCSNILIFISKLAFGFQVVPAIGIYSQCPVVIITCHHYAAL